MTCKPKTFRLWQEISLALALKAVGIYHLVRMVLRA